MTPRRGCAGLSPERAPSFSGGQRPTASRDILKCTLCRFSRRQCWAFGVLSAANCSSSMATYSIGEALSLLLERSKWKPKVHELRMRQEWEQITGKTIAKY